VKTLGARINKAFVQGSEQSNGKCFAKKESGE